MMLTVEDPKAIRFLIEVCERALENEQSMHVFTSGTMEKPKLAIKRGYGGWTGDIGAVTYDQWDGSSR